MFVSHYRVMECNAQLKTEFEADDLELRLRQSKVACVLGMVLIPAGITLDSIS